MRNRKTASILLIFLVTQLSYSTTWKTVFSGFWSSPATWINGIVPPLSSSDTFYIKHPVAIENSLVLNSGAFFRIDTLGGICGHRKITVKTGAKLVKYGIFQIDSLMIPGGQVQMLATGPVTLTCTAIINNGGNMSISGCAFYVGPWFDCRNPEFEFTFVEENDLQKKILVYPNPSSSFFTVASDINIDEIQMRDVLGRLIVQFTPKENSQIIQPEKEGIYFLTILAGKKKLIKKIICIR